MLHDQAGTDSSGAASTRRSTAPDAQEQRMLRERVTQLAFGSDRRRFDEFVCAIRDATPPDVEVILRGSAVTGHKWLSTEPFDADGPGTSDLDVTFVGGDMVSLYNEFHIPHLHSVPLSEEHPSACPTLVELRERLCAMAGRPVNLQATTSLVQFLRDVVMNQPYLILVNKPDADARSE
jgi:hypothetical protein